MKGSTIVAGAIVVVALVAVLVDLLRRALRSALSEHPSRQTFHGR